LHAVFIYPLSNNVIQISPLATPVAMATNHYYSKTKLTAAQHVLKCLRHCNITHVHIFPCTNFHYPSGDILKTMNKFNVIKSNTNLKKSTKKQQKLEQKTVTVYKAYIHSRVNCESFFALMIHTSNAFAFLRYNN